MNAVVAHATPVFDSIAARRSVRRYDGRAVPRALLEHVLTAATWAPSAHNRQPWRFAVVTDADAKARLAVQMGARLQADRLADGDAPDVVAADVARSYARLTEAPALIVLCLSMEHMDNYPDARRTQNETIMATQSVAMAGQNLMLAAHEAGLGACWLCAPLFAPDVVRAALDLPQDWRPQGVITLGYPAQVKPKERAPLAEKVVWR